ncbi:hypothetical protein QBC34DRAFT_288677, partial [Podospora aff. communis PSN243]
CKGTICGQILSATTLTDSTSTFLFARGVDSAIWYREIISSPLPDGRNLSDITTHVWKSDWHSLGGSLVSQPASSSMRPGRIDVFAIGTDQTTRVKTLRNGVWDKEWISLGGAAASPPATCSYGIDNNNVVMVGTDHGVYHKYLNDGNTWGPTIGGEWEEQRGLAWSSADTGCAVTVGGVRRYEIVMFGGAVGMPQEAELLPRGMYFMRFNTSHGWDGSWSGGEGNYRGNPTMVATANRTDSFGLEVQPIGTELSVPLYVTGWTQQGGLEARVSLGGNSRSVAAAYATGFNRLDVFVVGNDTRLKHRVRLGGDWGADWEDLGGSFSSAPQPVVLNDTAVAVFGVGTDGSVIHGVFLTTTESTWGQGQWYSDGGNMSTSWYQGTFTSPGVR